MMKIKITTSPRTQGENVLHSDITLTGFTNMLVPLLNVRSQLLMEFENRKVKVSFDFVPSILFVSDNIEEEIKMDYEGIHNIATIHKWLLLEYVSWELQTELLKKHFATYKFVDLSDLFVVYGNPYSLQFDDRNTVKIMFCSKVIFTASYRVTPNHISIQYGNEVAKEGFSGFGIGGE